MPWSINGCWTGKTQVRLEFFFDHVWPSKLKGLHIMKSNDEGVIVVFSRGCVNSANGASNNPKG